jgi:hypothetical protein
MHSIPCIYNTYKKWKIYKIGICEFDRLSILEAFQSQSHIYTRTTYSLFYIYVRLWFYVYECFILFHSLYFFQEKNKRTISYMFRYVMCTLAKVCACGSVVEIQRNLRKIKWKDCEPRQVSGVAWWNQILVYKPFWPNFNSCIANILMHWVYDNWLMRELEYRNIGFLMLL